MCFFGWVRPFSPFFLGGVRGVINKFLEEGINLCEGGGVYKIHRSREGPQFSTSLNILSIPSRVF